MAGDANQVTQGDKVALNSDFKSSIAQLSSRQRGTQLLGVHICSHFDKRFIIHYHVLESIRVYEADLIFYS